MRDILITKLDTQLIMWLALQSQQLKFQTLSWQHMHFWNIPLKKDI